MMDKHAIKEKGKQLIDHLPGWGDIHGAFTWQDRQESVTSFQWDPSW